MLASPVPIYLGCAGLIVGSLGLGAQYLIGGNSGSATDASGPPLFAQSVEEALLPADRWTSQNRGVAHYGPMVELLTTPARSTAASSVAAHPQQNSPVAAREAQTAEPQRAEPQRAEPAQEQPRTAPREVVRDTSQPQPRQSRRTRNQRDRHEVREDTTASAEQIDPREARAQATRQETRGQERRRTATQDVETREQGARRSERRYRDRDDAEVVEPPSRYDRRRVERDDRRLRDDERRVVIREEIREPDQRMVRGPEREGGFSPFRLFGIFDR